ncbi:LuxR C-terminal-related transcriptional regulator [Draconibacterium halophilum]|uniref:Uncharacterized protein n=1 Tax=Draconibacterium halophilum TaxID=2706887 RepID=A0A6C0RF39_9BACT|nr:LuxR C-terminal-related transcriptional regulator [Draconibacterium halophilum]QIA08153.1 hypothetical protein G0Q07_10680 [Draconibacterium halophilum]
MFTSIMKNHSKNLIIFHAEMQDSCIDLLLKDKGFTIIRVSQIDVIIKKIIDEDADLVICPYKINGESGFSIFNRIKPFLLKNAIPFFLLMEKYDEHGIKIGLEIGIDNFIFKPYHNSSIVQKINQALNKRTEVNVFALKHFKKYFASSEVAMFYLEKDEVICVNEAFCKLSKRKKEDFENQHFDWLFSFTGNTENEYNYRRFTEGGADVCKLKNVTCCNTNGFAYTISLHRGNQYNINSVFGEVVPIGEIPENHNNPNIQPNTKSRLEWAKEMFGLTRRELEVFQLSAKGLPVKQIAADLGIAERTIEKHRANIMRKSETRSMLEAILAVDNKYTTVYN